MEKAAKFIVEKLQSAGFVAYFAGGCVRDRILGVEPKDYDIATSAKPAEIAQIFPKSDSIGAHFGVMLVHQDGEHVEVATFRRDGEYLDSRHPNEVVFSTPEEDAQRRDFTINGLFYDPIRQQILDFVGGQQDLELGVIRAIGNPQARFSEDALRLMRAVRFSTQTKFKIEPQTWTAIQQNAELLNRISIERIQVEFAKILLSSNRKRGVEMLVNSGLIAQFLPEYLETIGCEQPPQWHPEGDVYQHTQMMLGMIPPNSPLELALGILLHDIGKPATRTVDETGRIRFNRHDSVGAEMAESILTRLKFSNKIIESVVQLVLYHMRFMNVMVMRTGKLREFMARSTFDLELELHRVDCLASNGLLDNYEFLLEKKKEFENRPLIPKPFLTGNDLISLGIPQGPLIGKYLQVLKDAQLNEEITNQQEAKVYLKSLCD